MKRFIIVLLTGISCYAWSQQKIDITKPMYGKVEKDESFKKAVASLRKDMIEKFGSVDEAVNDVLDKAWVLFFRNDLETAMIYFNQAWSLNPDFPDAYFGFAALLEMQRQYVEAIRFYQSGAEKDKDNQRSIICLLRIADCKEQLNDLRGAIDALSKIRNFNSDNPIVFKKSGYLYMKMGQRTASLEAYTKAIELDPNDAVSFHNRAYVYQMMEDNTKAITDYTRSVILDPTFVSSYVNRGILEMQRGNFDASIQDFQTGIRLDPKKGEIRRLLGLAKLNVNDKQGACDDFKIAKELGDPLAGEIINEYCK